MTKLGRIAPMRHGNAAKIAKTEAPPKTPFPLRSDIIAALGELVGMTIFIFLALSGVQAALAAPNGNGNPVPKPGGPTYSQIQSVAFSFGAAITVALFICAPISGGALNPAVLLSLLVTGNAPWFRGILLFIAEIVGSILGSYFANFVTANKLLGVNTVSPEFNNAQACFAEALMTCCLCLTVLFIIVDNNVLVTFTPFVVGMAVFICHMIGTPIDGTSINPARSFGPAVVTGIWTSQQWIFWVGPLTGAMFASIIYLCFKALRWEQRSQYEREIFAQDLESGMDGGEPLDEDQTPNGPTCGAVTDDSGLSRQRPIQDNQSSTDQDKESSVFEYGANQDRPVNDFIGSADSRPPTNEFTSNPTNSAPSNEFISNPSVQQRPNEFTASREDLTENTEQGRSSPRI